ncbi:DUF5317 domain-containing protein [Alkaliphilus hydrothermalis]|uniref:DUF5317 domain-containing protein n=1 Tax=Alkaliphilus hydrothermalis TaxID=1482730 RepID=A0ABS2NR19_9FIRM|nr:DUF5317 domain-containing protein [Alkaliphilus hydrothermalis]MBM7615397.1 hypothetical protein [Alkaliphilus hydrothermalis]
MIFEALVLGIIVGKIRGGHLKRLGYLSLRFPFVVIMSLILMLTTSIMIAMGNETFIEHRMILYIIIYCLLFTTLFLNLHKKAIWLILIGAICNFAAIVLNQGSMPIDLTLLEDSGFKNLLISINMGALPNYIPLEEAFPLTEYLGKRFITPSFYPLKQVLAVGDFLISIGLLFYIQSVMQSKLYRKAVGVISFDHHGRVRR